MISLYGKPILACFVISLVIGISLYFSSFFIFCLLMPLLVLNGVFFYFSKTIGLMILRGIVWFSLLYQVYAFWNMQQTWILLLFFLGLCAFEASNFFLKNFLNRSYFAPHVPWWYGQPKKLAHTQVFIDGKAYPVSHIDEFGLFILQILPKKNSFTVGIQESNFLLEFQVIPVHYEKQIQGLGVRWEQTNRALWEWLDRRSTYGLLA